MRDDDTRLHQQRVVLRRAVGCECEPGQWRHFDCPCPEAEAADKIARLPRYNLAPSGASRGSE